jgi:threonine dehydrogenase-like Zn-dependent dehydrogenase
VALDDLGDVRGLHAAVPDVVGVDDHCSAEFAGVEATGGVGADLLREASPVEFLLQEIADLLRALGRAATLGVVGRSLVGADEDVPFKRGNR